MPAKNLPLPLAEDEDKVKKQPGPLIEKSKTL